MPQTVKDGQMCFSQHRYVWVTLLTCWDKRRVPPYVTAQQRLLLRMLVFLFSSNQIRSSASNKPNDRKWQRVFVKRHTDPVGHDRFVPKICQPQGA
jgi:hypothetical protein